MAERVLANPLSGLEVRNAILDKLSSFLQRDCFLSPNLAYDYFSCTVKVSIELHDVGRTDKVEVKVTETEGDHPDDDALLEQADKEFEINPAPPNEVRVDTGQEVPVLAKAADGRGEIRGIKYKRPSK